MLQGWRNLGPKTAKKPASLTGFCYQQNLSLSLSLSPPWHSATNIVTTGLNTSLSITSNRPNTSYSKHAAEPLSSATFLLPSPAIETGHHSLHRSLLSHRPNLLIAAKHPPQVSLFPLPFLPFLLFLRRVLHCSRCMWIMESNPLLKKKIPKNLFNFFLFSRVFFYLFCVILVCIFIP